MVTRHDSSGTAGPSTGGLLPLVVAVGGHRDLRPEDASRLGERFREILGKFQRRYPRTPIVLLSSLAEGADRLGARVALDQGCSLVAPLPLSLEDYSQDFPSADSQAEFKELLGRADEWFVVPGEPGDSRDRHYARATAYIAHRSHLVIALWDEEPARGAGGTADLVSFALEGIPEGYRESRTVLDPAEGRPVVQIVTPRLSTPATREGPFLVKWRYPAAYGDAVAAAPVFERLWQRVETFNEDAHRLSEVMVTSALLPGDHAVGLSKRFQALQRCYAVADALSLRFQRLTYWTLYGLIFLAMAAALAFQADQLLKPSNPVLRTVSFGALVCAYLWWLCSRRWQWQTRHLDYRALAEGLRVQFFWKLAGLDRSAADHYLRKQRSELDWIRRAVRAWDVGPSTGSDRGPGKLGLVLDHWVRSQRAYFARSAARNDRRKRLIGYAGIVFLTATISLACLTLFLGTSHPLLAAAGLVPAMWAFVNFYADKTALAPLAKQYARMTYGFAAAEDALASSLQSADHLRVQDLLGELGVEALSENGDWVLLYRERPLDVPRPN